MQNRPIDWRLAFERVGANYQLVLYKDGVIVENNHEFLREQVLAPYLRMKVDAQREGRRVYH